MIRVVLSRFFGIVDFSVSKYASVFRGEGELSHFFIYH